MINRKNLSRLSIGCLILGLAAFGSIFLFGSRGQLEQSCWDKAVELIKQEEAALDEMLADNYHQMRDPSYFPPPYERQQRQERLDDIHRKQIAAELQARELDLARYDQNHALLLIAIGFGAASLLGGILIFVTRPQIAKQNP